jgi:hypothetical protein
MKLITKHIWKIQMYIMLRRIGKSKEDSEMLSNGFIDILMLILFNKKAR